MLINVAYETHFLQLHNLMSSVLIDPASRQKQIVQSEEFHFTLFLMDEAKYSSKILYSAHISQKMGVHWNNNQLLIQLTHVL